jgi:hypothetical protein
MAMAQPGKAEGSGRRFATVVRLTSRPTRNRRLAKSSSVSCHTECWARPRGTSRVLADDPDSDRTAKFPWPHQRVTIRA